MSDSKIAVLQFNHSDKQALTIQEIAPRVNKRGLAKMLSQFQKRTSKVASETGHDHFQYSISSNNSFQEQLFEAYTELFNQGYQKVIGIANDCPALAADDIRLAADKLQDHNFVFGPAKDGGLYLLAVSKDALLKESFLKLSWRTGKLYQEFVELAQKLSYPSFSLEAKADMDTAEEFKQAFRSHHLFLSHLKKLTASFQQHRFALIVKKKIYQKVDFLSLRAPPLAH